MDREDHLQYPFLPQAEYPSCLYTNNQNQKTSHPYKEEDDIQLHKNSFFFFDSPIHPSNHFLTPIAPKNQQYDIAKQRTAKSETKKSFNANHFQPNFSSFLNLQDKNKTSKIQENTLNMPYKKQSSKIDKPASKSPALRNLSKAVYKTIKELGITCNSILAKKIVNEAIARGEIDSEKDECNIRRRIYDVFNVLAAAGILNKQGKDLSCNLNYQINQADSLKMKGQSAQRQRIEQQLKKKQAQLEQKRNMLQEVKQKKRKIAKIFNRNRQKHHNSKRIFQFPLISTFIDQQNAYLEKKSRSQALLHSRYISALFGDLDLLVRIPQEQDQKFHQNHRQFKLQQFIKNQYFVKKQNDSKQEA